MHGMNAPPPTPSLTLFKKAREILTSCDNMVFFGGAGLSTESGIPDFRSADGIYHQAFRYPPETVLGLSFFSHHPDAFYEFYRERVLHPIRKAQPNPAHLKLAEWEKEGRLRAVITQNIDGLHQKAGSSNVLELHGSVYRNYCSLCKKGFPLERVLKGQGPPRCGCGGIVRPDVVLFEEHLNEGIVSRTLRHLRDAEVLIVAGTSMSVYPAAGLVRHFHGHPLILINRGTSGIDDEADIILRGNVGEILGAMRPQ